MSSDFLPRPPQGADPIDECLPPPRSSVLQDDALAAIQPPLHTTLLDTSVFPTTENQVPRPTLLAPSALASDRPVPHPSFLPPSDGPIPPPSVSVLKPDILSSLSIPKRPNLVRPMPEQPSNG
ncbi:hypothetical protein [Vacuolonema iberomarrocanum]|uniref:hypothetical protein n=1 Tax=Vacuolonema iberomarrocanum TaxID=3454632 RepID=UPI0019F4DAAA|nr:hypothetical protein [filamentous cyanobacterium LEGE 07170]